MIRQLINQIQYETMNYSPQFRHTGLLRYALPVMPARFAMPLPRHTGPRAFVMPARFAMPLPRHTGPEPSSCRPASLCLSPVIPAPEPVSIEQRLPDIPEATVQWIPNRLLGGHADIF
jgi:hypothetical protein